MRYGVFSNKQAEICGTHFYRKPDGDEVEVTHVDDGPGCPGCFFEDKVDVGPVTEWVRVGKKPTSPFPVIRELRKSGRISEKRISEKLR